MLERTMEEFICDAEKLIVRAAADDDFVKIKTGAGNAVLISEDEWNSLMDAFKLAIQAAK